MKLASVLGAACTWLVFCPLASAQFTAATSVSNWTPRTHDASGGDRYEYSDSSSENLLGLTNGGDLAWMTLFSTEDLGRTEDVIVEVATSWGSALFPGQTPFEFCSRSIGPRFVIWDDTDDDGDPTTGLECLYEQDICTNDIVDNDIKVPYGVCGIVPVEGDFFVGFAWSHEAGELVAPMDTSQPSTDPVSGRRRSWLAAHESWIDCRDLNGPGSLGVFELDAIGMPAVWMTYAVGGGSPLPPQGEQRLDPTVPPASFSEYGASVGISGDTAIVGAPFDENDGTAYLFDLVSGAELFRLKASNGMSIDQFGRSVAVFGERALVGAPGTDGVGFQSGSAYLFDTTNGSELAELTASDAAEFDDFGFSVAIGANHIVVGAIDGDGTVADTGAAYVFDLNGQELFKLSGPNGADNDLFGYTVAISGTLAAIGAPGEGDGEGAAYVFDLTTGQQLWRLTSPEIEDFDQLGISVGISGNLVVAGAPGDDDVADEAGAAYVFDATSGEQVAKLTATDGRIYDSFGDEVAISGTTTIASSVYHVLQGCSSGAVYGFDALDGTELFQLRASDAGDEAGFGDSLSIDGQRFVAGSPWIDAAHAFVALPDPVTYCTAKTNSCGTAPAIGSFGVASASSGEPFDVRVINTRAEKVGLLLYTDSGRRVLPFDGGLLCVNPDPLRRSVLRIDTSGTPGDCNGVLSIDMNAYAAGNLGGNPLPSLQVPGTQVNGQFWGRDTQAHGSLLSDAIEYFVGP